MMSAANRHIADSPVMGGALELLLANGGGLAVGLRRDRASNAVAPDPGFCTQPAERLGRDGRLDELISFKRTREI